MNTANFHSISKLSTTNSITPGTCIAYQTILKDALYQLGLLSNITNDSRPSKYNSQKSAESTKKIAKHRSLINEIFTSTLAELNASMKYPTLTAWIEKENDLQDLLYNTIRREKEATQLLSTMQDQITQEIQATEKENYDKDAIIQQLKDAINEIRHISTAETTFLKTEYSAKHTYNASTRELELSNLTQEKERWNQCITSEEEIHDTLMEFLARQKEVLEEDVNIWAAKYETDLDLKSKELNDIKSNRLQAAEEFEKMSDDFERMEKFIEEYNLNRLKKFEEEILQFRSKYAAKRIQKWWKAYLAKKRAASSVKKTKGKKSGGKRK